MILHIDVDSSTPPYAQLRDQLAELVNQGSLQPGDKLPTVRKLADDLQLAPNTVAKVYRELETAGVLDTRGRSGTFVAGHGLDQAARSAAATYVAAVRALGLSDTQALDQVRRALA